MKVGWTEVTLGEIVDSVGGGTPSKARPEFYGGEIPWVTPKDMKTPEISDSQVRITDLGLARSSSKLVPAGSVLVVVRSGVLKHTLPVALATAPVALNQDIRALIPGPRIDGRYLAYAIRASAPEVLRWVRATTADNFPFERLLKLPIALPSTSEQQRIVRALDLAAAAAAHRQRTLSTLRLLRESVAASVLDGVYRHRNLGDIAEIKGGVQVTRSRERLDLKVPYLRVANVHRGVLDLQEIKQIGVREAELERCRLLDDDLLFVEGHGNRAEIGRVARWDNSDSVPDCVHQNHLIRARVDRSVLRAVVAEAYINSPRGRQAVQRSARTTSGLNTISTRDVRALSVPIPTPVEQRHLEERLAAIDASLKSAKIHSEELQSLESSLLRTTLSAELRIRERPALAV